MFVVFRTDGGAETGSGHVMRCLTLAQSLVSYGTDVLFVCADVAGHLGELIAGRGFVLQLIPARPDVGGGGLGQTMPNKPVQCWPNNQGARLIGWLWIITNSIIGGSPRYELVQRLIALWSLMTCVIGPTIATCC